MLERQELANLWQVICFLNFIPQFRTGQCTGQHAGFTAGAINRCAASKECGMQ